MARIPFVGESFTLFSTAAAAQESMNVYPEVMDDPNEQAKGRVILRGAPGAHTLVHLQTIDGAAHPIRGFWSGGGRLFVAAGTRFMEINQSGGLVGSVYVIDDDAGHSPVQIFGNAVQLLIVSAGQVYVDNGAGPVKARFQLNGTVAIAGTSVTWVAGDQFPTYTPSTSDPLPTAVFINIDPTLGVVPGAVLITFTSATTATLAVSLVGGSGTVTFYGDSGDVFWSSGTTFDPSWVGNKVVIGANTYTIAAVLSSTRLQTMEIPGGGISYGQSYTVTIGNCSYSTAGGDLVTAVTGAYLDGSGYVQRPPGGSPDLGRQVNFSAVDDFTVWNGLDFFTKEGGPDYISTIFADREQLYVFGTEESEVWQNDPTTGRPVRLPGAAAREGNIAPWGVVSLAQTIFFLGGSPRGQAIAYKLVGFTPVRVSTHAVEEAWNTLASFAEEAIAYPYIEDGHQFWMINFTNPTNTWVYDATESDKLGTPIWHQRSRWGGVDAGFTGYPWWYHTFIPEWLNGVHIVGDFDSDSVAMLSNLFYDDESADIAWRRALPYRYNGGKRIFFGRQTLEMETGSVPSGPEPTITRDYSDDRGNTFVNPQTAGIGIHGDGTRRVYWPAGGSSRGRVWRLFGQGQYQVCLIDIDAEEQQGIV